MGTVIMLGDRSDIAKELSARFLRDGWEVAGWRRNGQLPMNRWDALVCALGVLEPIGRFFNTDPDDWERAVESNALLPLRLLRRLWRFRNPGASVCFFSGAGVTRSAATYSAYSASKMLLFKMTELLDDENADAKFFILGPGMVRTKIQRQTVLAGPDAAANWERVMQFMAKGDDAHGEGTPHEKIYEVLRWCMEQPKEIVGGRNFYVPTDVLNNETAARLALYPHMYKLRRHGGDL